jgi:hypothetical protein
MTKILPRPRKTLPPLKWNKSDPVATKRTRNTLRKRKSRARRTDSEEEMSHRIEYLERELTAREEEMSRFVADLEQKLKTYQEREKFWMEQAQNHDERSSPPDSTFQSKQDISLPSGVSNRISITSLVESTSTGASEPRDCILSSQLRLFKCPHSGCATAPFKTKYELE